jgi:hypothetical protein
MLIDIGPLGGLGQINLHDIEGRPPNKLSPHSGRDHVIGGRHNISQGPNNSKLITQRPQRKNLSHNAEP